MPTETHADKNEALVARLLSGDMSARDEMIELNQPLVYTTVTRVLRRWPALEHIRDELQGVGILALVKIVNRLVVTGDVQRPVRNYLIKAIHDSLISEIRKSYRYYQVHRHVDAYEKLPEECLAVEDTGIARFVDRDYLMAQCVTERERDLLYLHFEGHSRPEIAAILGMTINVVNDVFEVFVRRVAAAEKVEKFQKIPEKMSLTR